MPAADLAGEPDKGLSIKRCVGGVPGCIGLATTPYRPRHKSRWLLVRADTQDVFPVIREKRPSHNACRCRNCAVSKRGSPRNVTIVNRAKSALVAVLILLADVSLAPAHAADSDESSGELSTVTIIGTTQFRELRSTPTKSRRMSNRCARQT